LWPSRVSIPDAAGDPTTGAHLEPTCRTVIATLGFTQILAWGSSYYLPAVLAEPITRDTHWPLTWVVSGLSVGLVLAALVSPHVGKAIERSGGRRVLALSALAIGMGQLGLAVAPNLTAYISAWIVIGAGMGAGLYDAAFATLGRLYGRGARSAITTLTLFGGFASTVCWPLSALLVSEIGWRGACLVYAVIQLAVAFPLYLSVLPGGPSQATAPSGRAHSDPASGRTKASPLLIVLLAVTIILAAMISSLVSVHLLMILQASGIALAAAVGLSALVGPSQVAARTVEMFIARFHHPIWTKIVSASFVAVGISTLWAGMPFVPASLAFYGSGIGLESIARGTLPLALFGRVRLRHAHGPPRDAEPACPGDGSMVGRGLVGTSWRAWDSGGAFMRGRPERRACARSCLDRRT
jgi:MFS family permease